MSVVSFRAVSLWTNEETIAPSPCVAFLQMDSSKNKFLPLIHLLTFTENDEETAPLEPEEAFDEAEKDEAVNPE